MLRGAGADGKVEELGERNFGLFSRPGRDGEAVDTFDRDAVAAIALSRPP